MKRGTSCRISSVTNLVDYIVTGETKMWITFIITERPNCVFFFYIEVNSIFFASTNAKSFQLSWQIERKHKINRVVVIFCYYSKQVFVVCNTRF